MDNKPISQGSNTSSISNKGQNTTAHEFGHVFGLPDDRTSGQNLMQPGPGVGLAEQDINTILNSPINDVDRCDIDEC